MVRYALARLRNADGALVGETVTALYDDQFSYIQPPAPVGLAPGEYRLSITVEDTDPAGWVDLRRPGPAGLAAPARLALEARR